MSKKRIYIFIFKYICIYFFFSGGGGGKLFLFKRSAAEFVFVVGRNALVLPSADVIWGGIFVCFHKQYRTLSQ